jgi:hypothetical protein
MKKLAYSIALLALLALPTPAQAQARGAAPAARSQTPLQLELQIRPVANQGELVRLMRQNSVRVALQRHRLWQQAVAREEQQDQTRAPKQHRYRHRVRQSTMGASTPAMALKTVDTPSKVGVPVPRSMNRPAVAPMTPRNLRQLLRQGRSGDAERLERKLRARVREQQRQRTRLRDRSRQGSSMGAHHGGRSGR